MASREYEALLSALTQKLFPASDPLDVARDKLEAVHGHPVGEDTSVEWTALGGVDCAWVIAPNAEVATRTLVLCHGGAYVAGARDGYLFYADMLSRACDARVLLVDYRLAPEHRHPAALDDCANAYLGMVDAGVLPADVVFIGDSCGGGLAICALLRLRESGRALPAGAVTLGGWFDLEARSESAVAPRGHDPFAEAAFLRARGRDYVGESGDLADPLVSPVHADLGGLPPLLLQVGQVDLTRDDAFRLAANAAREGVDVTLEVHPEMVHGFQGLANAGIPEARAALARVASWVARVVPAR